MASKDLGKLLRSSKFAQLVPSKGRLLEDTQKAHPTHQIIEAPPSSFHRRNFGLKYNLPEKLKSRYIVVESVDNEDGLPEFENLSGFYWKKLRFQEMNIPISSAGGKNPLFFDKTLHPLDPNDALGIVQTNEISKLLNILPGTPEKKFAQVQNKLSTLRRPFFKWLAKAHPDKVANQDLLNEVIEFLKLHPQLLEVPELPLRKYATDPAKGSLRLAGTGGLSYKLKGRLTNSPDGIQTAKAVPGRFLEASSIYRPMAVGGFVGNASSRAHGAAYAKTADMDPARHIRETKLALNVTRATFDRANRNKLTLEVDPLKASSTTSTFHPFGKSTGPKSDSEANSIVSIMSLLQTARPKKDSPQDK
ncbi:unnamed protein product [Kuraishia capsulata CBS 1993]|uniref:Uncharacterized protein n=1 Tax=Kuraishia capsulata CBS 1993 TaxID=1382522 RepID=W6MFC1_9ASCO|nr:uncharacterized protein KUCA_T00000422001 [Kuraishia capsulata CBS 1993]CDK24459.1 unnamed protein product [Kuraishia capsulata CBS 1993]